MKCHRCFGDVVMHGLCEVHFCEWFEENVRATIKKFKLLQTGDKVLVAASGGKDSTTTIFLLKKFGYDITVLAVDEGIAGYRDRTLHDLKVFCFKNDVPLEIISFRQEFHTTLDLMAGDGGTRSSNNSKNSITNAPPPCTICGTLRRFLLNKHAKGYDAIATGHNADDEAQAVLMNLCRANTELFPRGGPQTMSGGNFVKRVKPLYFCTEKEVLTYALLNKLTGTFTECPYVIRAYRAEVRDVLNDFEQQHPGTKQKILEHYLKVRPASISTTTKRCSRCGEPAIGTVCKACRIVEEMVKGKK